MGSVLSGYAAERLGAPLATLLAGVAVTVLAFVVLRVFSVLRRA